MKKIAFILLVLNLTFIQGYAQTWNTNTIPDSLKKNADAVIREYSTTYHRISLQKCIVTVHEVITVLHEKGKYAAYLRIGYDQNSKVTNFKGFVYNQQGRLIRKISKKKDVQDVANSSGMFSDNRMKVCNYTSNTYPYTVEYFYEIEDKGFIGVAPWRPQQTYNLSTQRSKLTFKTAPNLGIKYKELNPNFKFAAGTNLGQKTYRWTASNLKAINHEPFSSDYLDIFPTVLISLGEISYEGTKGNFSTWNTYGKWLYELVEDRKELPEETIAKMKELTDSIPSKKGKVKAIYQYMQGKTRYVYVGLGIGGLQPAPASQVDTKGYGDCKGLSNYTKTLLNAVGIDAYYAEIGNGDNQKLKFRDLPNLYQTNHIILCVPVEKDTTWLECTSQNIPFGYIGGGNSDRYAMLVTEEGGVLVRTPTYEADKNIRKSVINVNLKENGEGIIQADWNFKNYLYEEIGFLNKRSQKEQKKYLLENSLNSEGLDISDFSIKDISNQEAELSLQLNAKIGKYAKKSGSMLFVQADFLYEHSFLNHISSKRKQNLYQAIGYTYQDSLTIQIPKDFKVNNLPQKSEFSSIYGTYSINYENVANKLFINRSIHINKGTFGKETFEEINTFLKAIVKQDKTKILLMAK